jgi:hypothetical protein
MKARIIRGLIDTGSAARDFIRLVSGCKSSPVGLVTKDETLAGAPGVLETFRNHRRKRESDYILTGRRVIEAMDEQMTDFSVPFEFTATARSLGKGIVEGSLVVIPGDDRVFRVLRIWYEHESVRIGDLEDPRGPQYVVPWRMIRLVQQKRDSR